MTRSPKRKTTRGTRQSPPVTRFSAAESYHRILTGVSYGPVTYTKFANILADFRAAHPHATDKLRKLASVGLAEIAGLMKDDWNRHGQEIARSAIAVLGVVDIPKQKIARSERVWYNNMEVVRDDSDLLDMLVPLLVKNRIDDTVETNVPIVCIGPHNREILPFLSHRSLETRVSVPWFVSICCKPWKWEPWIAALVRTGILLRGFRCEITGRTPLHCVLDAFPFPLMKRTPEGLYRECGSAKTAKLRRKAMSCLRIAYLMISRGVDLVTCDSIGENAIFKASWSIWLLKLIVRTVHDQHPDKNIDWQAFLSPDHPCLFLSLPKRIVEYRSDAWTPRNHRTLYHEEVRRRIETIVMIVRFVDAWTFINMDVLYYLFEQYAELETIDSGIRRADFASYRYFQHRWSLWMVYY